MVGDQFLRRWLCSSAPVYAAVTRYTKSKRILEFLISFRIGIDCEKVESGFAISAKLKLCIHVMFSHRIDFLLLISMICYITYNSLSLTGLSRIILSILISVKVLKPSPFHSIQLALIITHLLLSLLYILKVYKTIHL